MKKLFFCSSFLLIFCSIYFTSCDKEEIIRTPNNIDFTKIPYKTLSEYGFFSGELNQLIPSDKVLPYAPVSELFSDYAYKSRFIWMQEGTSAQLTADSVGTILFPNKSILIKNFYYPLDFNKPDGEKRVIETRLLIQIKGKWEAFAYVWNDEQTEAKYKITGAVIPVEFIDKNGDKQSFDYVQPNKNQCKSCHNSDGILLPIGPKAKNIDFDYTYNNTTIKNQLLHWSDMNYLEITTKSKTHQSMVNYKDESLDLNLRARAYLDINCAHCHNEKGSAKTSGLNLYYEETNTRKLGYFKPPIAAGIGAGPHKFGIHPSKADSSIMVYRMNSTIPAVMMPELGRTTIDKEGVQLISDWIDSLK